jgi:hypothetical protein
MRLPKDLRERGKELMWALEDPANAFDAFIDEANKELDQRREQEHDEAIVACRRQDELIAELEQKIFRSIQVKEKDDAAMHAALSELNAIQNSKPTRFPLKEETAAWEKSVEKAQRRFDKLEAEARLSSGGESYHRGELQKARVRLQELSEKEFNLRPKQENVSTSRVSFAPNPFGLAS